MSIRVTRTTAGIARGLSRFTVVQLVSGLGALFLVLVLTSSLVFIARQWSDARGARGERAALPAASALFDLAKLSAEHRGMAALALGGDPQFRDRRSLKALAVDLSLLAALDATRRWDTPRIRGLRVDIAASWRALDHAVAHGDVLVRNSFAWHTALIGHQLELLDEIVSVSTLTLDADAVARNLIVAAMRRQPQLIELLGELRGYGAAVLANAAATPYDRGWMTATLANARRMFHSGMRQVERAGAAQPSVLVTLAPQITAARAAFEQVAALVDTAFRDDGGRRMTAAGFFAITTKAIDAQAALADATFATLDTVLQARADAARRAAAIAVAAGVALLLLSAWLVGSIIRSVRGDLRAREQARTAATRTSAFLSTMLEAAPDAVVIVDAGGAIELASAQVAATFGYARDELLGMPARVLFPDLPGTSEPSAPGAMDRRVVAMDCTRKDGARFPMEVGSSPVPMGRTSHRIVVARDVTERRTMEQQLRQSQRMESIGQLTGGLAHDFNNLLAVIVGNLDLLERHVAHDERAAARVRTAQRAAMRGATLTRRLLAFARRQHLDPQPTAVNQTIGELLEMLPRTLGPEIKIVTKLDVELPPATVDASGLESALLNLALNARDAMPGGGRLAIATSLVHLDREYGPVKAGEIDAGSYVRIAVSDTGHGMSPDTISKVFEPFFTTKPRGKGTGLGLAMVYGFVKQSRGNIRVYSELGVGTTFSIDLPLAEAAAPARIAAVAVPHATLPAGGAKPIVLVVDDEVDLLEIAVSYCEELGLEVLHASDGPSALEIAAELPHLDLLLTDVVMPGGLNGVALAARLRVRYPQLKVVYSSGFPSSALAERSQLREDGPLINKPYRKHAFAQCVIEALATSTSAIEEHAA